MEACQVRQPTTATSAIIKGNVRPKFTIQKLTAELEKPGSLCNQPGAQARIDFAWK